MIRYGKHSKLNPPEVVQKAVAYFGPGGMNLDMQLIGEGEVRFEGGGGYVLVQAEAKEKGSDVDLIAVEWENDARRFLAKI